MKSKRKRVLLAVVGAAVLLAAGVFGFWQYRRATWRYPYSPETRQLHYSEAMMSFVYFPSMETTLRFADNVVRGVVTEVGESPFADASGMSFSIRVKETLLGAPTPDTLTLYISGDRESGVAKPHQNDDLVLFLIYYPDYEIYQLAEREAAMFAVMPGNTLYAFYTHPSFVEYDNRPVNDLYTSILEAAINIRDNPDEYEDTFAPGDILDGLLDPQSGILSPLESIVESAS